MPDDSTNAGQAGLQDDFDAQDPPSGGGAALTADAVSGAAPVAVHPAPEAEIEMAPEWVGRGNPPRPQQVRDDIEAKTNQAEAARQRAQQLGDQERKLDADVDVAVRLLAARTEDRQELQDRLQTLETRRAELVDDAARNQPDVDRAVDEVKVLERQLGIKVPSDDLLPPDGTPAPAPVTPETDPVKIAALQEQLTQAEQKLQQVVAARDTTADAELARIEAEEDALKPQLAQAESALQDQQRSVDELKVRADTLEQSATESLEHARGLEAEVKNLTDALPSYEQVWATWADEHPDEAKVTDLGTIDVKVPPRETAMLYAQGRREEAGRLEQQAADSDHAAADATNGAQSRIELAQRNDEAAAEINQRLASSTARVTALQSQADEASQRADKLAADADRMSAEAKQLRNQGRADAADTMDARARSMTDESIKAKFQADDLQRQATAITESTESERARAETLGQEASQLRSEASTLTAQTTELQQQAAKLRENAVTRDHIAQEVEDRLQSGQPFKFQLVDDRMGESITLDVPAGPPPYTPPPATDGAGGEQPTLPTGAAATTDPPVGDTAADSPVGDMATTAAGDLEDPADLDATGAGGPGDAADLDAMGAGGLGDAADLDATGAPVDAAPADAETGIVAFTDLSADGATVDGATADGAIADGAADEDSTLDAGATVPDLGGFDDPSPVADLDTDFAATDPADGIGAGTDDGTDLEA